MCVGVAQSHTPSIAGRAHPPTAALSRRCRALPVPPPAAARSPIDAVIYTLGATPTATVLAVVNRTGRRTSGDTAPAGRGWAGARCPHPERRTAAQARRAAAPRARADLAQQQGGGGATPGRSVGTCSPSVLHSARALVRLRQPVAGQDLVHDARVVVEVAAKQLAEAVDVAVEGRDFL